MTIEWIKVSDRLPDDGRLVLVCYVAEKSDYPEEKLVRELHYNYITEEWCDSESNNVADFSWKISHWCEMPLSPDD